MCHTAPLVSRRDRSGKEKSVVLEGDALAAYKSPSSKRCWWCGERGLTQEHKVQEERPRANVGQRCLIRGACRCGRVSTGGEADGIAGWVGHEDPLIGVGGVAGSSGAELEQLSFGSLQVGGDVDTDGRELVLGQSGRPASTR